MKKDPKAAMELAEKNLETDPTNSQINHLLKEAAKAAGFIETAAFALETIVDADEATAVALMTAAHRIARAVQAAFKPEGMTLLQANKPAGWQTVPHLHMHVLPRWGGDSNFMTTIGETRVLPEDLDVTWQRLNDAFSTTR